MNHRARRLLRLEEERVWTCCELVCGAIDPEIAVGRARCLTQRVLKAGEPLPEVQVAGRGDRGNLTVTASRVDAEDVRVLLELRPSGDSHQGDLEVPQGAAGDSRHALRIHTMGSVRVDVGGERRDGAWLSQRPGMMLKYLVCLRHEVAASEQIAEAIWPGAAPHDGLASVRHYVHVLRELLEPDRPTRAPSSFIATRRGGYGLVSDQVWVDAEAFQRRASAGLRLHLDGLLEPAGAALEAAIALFGGQFLPDEPDAEWALEERDRLHQLARADVRGAGRGQDGDRRSQRGRRIRPPTCRPGTARQRRPAAIRSRSASGSGDAVRR